MYSSYHNSVVAGKSNSPVDSMTIMIYREQVTFKQLKKKAKM